MKTFQQFIIEAGDYWHPDPEQDRRISGAGNKLRARQDREDSQKDTSAQTPPDYSNRLKPGETYSQFNKRKQAEKIRKEDYDLSEKSLSRVVSNTNKSGIAIVSADRGDKTKGQNAERSKTLVNRIRGAGLPGPTKVKGAYNEKDHGEQSEKSFIVTPGKKGKKSFKKTITKLGQEGGLKHKKNQKPGSSQNDQDSVLIKQKPGSSSRASWLGTSRRSDADPKLGKKYDQGTLSTRNANKPLPPGEGGTKIKGKTVQFK